MVTNIYQRIYNVQFIYIVKQVTNKQLIRIFFLFLVFHPTSILSYAFAAMANVVLRVFICFIFWTKKSKKSKKNEKICRKRISSHLKIKIVMKNRRSILHTHRGSTMLYRSFLHFRTYNEMWYDNTVIEVNDVEIGYLYEFS